MEILILIIVNVANILSVWFAAKNNRLTWGIGFVGVAITAVMFFMSGHYMSFAFNTYSAIMCIIGHFRWNSSVQKNDEAIRWMKPYLPIVISLQLAVLIYAINVNLSHNPILDSIGTAVSIVAAYLLVKQDVNAWFLYLFSDVIYIYLGITSGDWEYIVIYGVMMLLAVYGTKEFIQKYKRYEEVQ